MLKISSPVAESAPTINSKAVEHAPAADVAASAISTAPDLVGQPLNAAPGADALASTAVIVAPIQNGDHVIPTPSSHADPYHGADFGLTDQSFDLTSPSNENDSEALVARGSAAVTIASNATPASHLLSINEAFGANSSTANSEITPAPVGTFFSLASAAPSSESIFFAPAATPHPGTPGSVWMTGDLGTLSTSSAGIGGSSASGGSFVQGGSAGSGLIINVNWDASVANAPVGFQAGVEFAVNYFESHFSNPITITLDVGYGEVNGQAMGAGALGESEFYLNSVSYSTLRSALVNNANAIGDSAAAASLPTNSPVNGYYWLTTAESQALGLSGASGVNGYIGLSSSYSFCYNDSNGVPSGQFDFFGTVAHEISEVMGRSMFDGQNFYYGPSYEPLDLFHYSAPGVRDFSGGRPGYFSANGGTTNLNNFNTNAGGDYGDWASSVGNDAFLAFSSPGVVNGISANDLTEMNLLGWDPKTATAPVVTIALADDTSGGKAITSNDALTGTADANATVTLSEGATLLGTTTSNASGVWSFTPSGLAQGGQTVTASETNAAGLTGSATLAFTYDTVSPTVTIALAHDTSGGKDISSNDALTGAADANAAVIISEGSAVLGTTTANTNGVWSFTPTALAQGLQAVTASDTNAAGLTGTASLSFTFDTVPPRAPIIISDVVNNDNSVTLTGTAEVNARVTVYDGQTLLGMTLADTSGAWNFTTKSADQWRTKLYRNSNRHCRQYQRGLERCGSFHRSGRAQHRVIFTGHRGCRRRHHQRHHDHAYRRCGSQQHSCRVRWIERARYRISR